MSSGLCERQQTVAHSQFLYIETRNFRVAMPFFPTAKCSQHAISIRNIGMIRASQQTDNLLSHENIFTKRKNNRCSWLNFPHDRNKVRLADQNTDCRKKKLVTELHIFHMGATPRNYAFHVGDYRQYTLTKHRIKDVCNLIFDRDFQLQIAHQITLHFIYISSTRNPQTRGW